jgi:hypothetical protein
MQFVSIGFLRAGTDAGPEILQQTIGFLEQPYIQITSAGALRDEGDRRVGMMMIFDAPTRAAAEALVKESPFLKADLYEQHHLFEYLDEVG